MSHISDFYSGRDVLITGATGFLGKVLIEKLLRSCPGIGKIFVIVRPKKGMDVDIRIENLLMSEVLYVTLCSHKSQAYIEIPF